MSEVHLMLLLSLQTNRELKRKLRDMMAALAAERQVGSAGRRSARCFDMPLDSKSHPVDFGPSVLKKRSAVDKHKPN